MKDGETKPEETPRTEAICAAINAALKPYSQYMTTATAMLLINQYREIAAMEKELQQLQSKTPTQET